MLAIRHLSRTFPGGTRALQGIDLSMAEGEVVAIVGGWGCGKSTRPRPRDRTAPAFEALRREVMGVLDRTLPNLAPA